MAIKRIWNYTIPVVAIAAKPPTFKSEDLALELRIVNEAFIKVYEVFEYNFCAYAVLAYVEGVAEY